MTETPNETPNGDYFCITHYSLLGRPPLYLPGAGAPGDLAVGSTPDALFAGPHDAKDSTEWHNRVPARSLLSFSWRRLVRRAAAIRCPILPSGLTHGRIPPCSACRRYTALRPIHGLAADPDLPTCLTVPAPDARSCQYSASRSTMRLRPLRAITTPFVTEGVATTTGTLAPKDLGQRVHLPTGHWLGQHAATDILVLARKGRAFRSLDTLITRQGGQHVLYGSALALAASIQTWSADTGTPVTDLTRAAVR